MSRLNEYSNYILKCINLTSGQYVEIISPIECKELVEVLRYNLLMSDINLYITYTNEDELYYKSIDRSMEFYDRLIKLQFTRIIISSSFTKKSDIFLDSQYDAIKLYFMQFSHQKVVVAYPSEIWANTIGISYLELKNRIIDLSLRNNPLTQYIDDLFDLDIKYANIKTPLGTNLWMEFTNNFRFSDGYLKTTDGIPYKANIPSLEIFTSPIKESLNGIIVGSKAICINGSVIKNFSCEFKNGKIVRNIGLNSLLSLEPNLAYCGELGIAFYSDFIFYNTLLDENLATHIAIGNSYNCGIRKSEQHKLNKSLYHFDLPIGTKDMIIDFYDKDKKKCACFDNISIKTL